MDSETKPWDRVEEPTVEKRDDKSMDREHRLRHPAFGAISISKSTGRTQLFGTDFIHNNFIRIEIHEAELNRSLSRDWIHPRNEVIEIWMSEAQWAALVSSFNVMPGIACTIRRVNGEYRPMFPFRQQVTHFAKEIKAKVQKSIDRLETLVQWVKDPTAGGQGMSAKRQTALVDALRLAEQDLRSDLPFVEESFNKHMEKTIEHAKVEVNAYAQNVVRQVGLEALAAGKGPIIQIGEGEEKEVDRLDDGYTGPEHRTRV